MRTAAFLAFRPGNCLWELCTGKALGLVGHCWTIHRMFVTSDIPALVLF